MHKYFPNRKLKNQEIKVNKKVKEAIKLYRDFYASMNNLLSDVFIVKKSKTDEIINTWLYNSKGIMGHNVESGRSASETAFLFAAMELKDENPTSIINAAFYANKTRNDSNFEIGYLAPQFLDMLRDDEKVLIINPSPDLVIYFENRFPGKKYYAVTDDTVAGLYSLEFPKSQFVSFANVDSLSDIDSGYVSWISRARSQISSSPEST